MWPGSSWTRDLPPQQLRGIAQPTNEERTTIAITQDPWMRVIDAFWDHQGGVGNSNSGAPFLSAHDFATSLQNNLHASCNNHSPTVCKLEMPQALATAAPCPTDVMCFNFTASTCQIPMAMPGILVNCKEVASQFGGVDDHWSGQCAKDQSASSHGSQIDTTRPNLEGNAACWTKCKLRHV